MIINGKTVPKVLESKIPGSNLANCKHFSIRSLNQSACSLHSLLGLKFIILDLDRADSHSFFRNLKLERVLELVIRPRATRSLMDLFIQYFEVTLNKINY